MPARVFLSEGYTSKHTYTKNAFTLLAIFLGDEAQAGMHVHGAWG